MVKANNKIAKCVLACGIWQVWLSISIGEMSDEELKRGWHNCYENEDKSACQALINNGLPSAEECPKNPKNVCTICGSIYYTAGHYHEAIPYFEKAIALGDRIYGMLGVTYQSLEDYYNAKKYYEMACNKSNGDLAHAEGCSNLGGLYYKGLGVRQDYYKAHELWKKACDMKVGEACFNLGMLYYKGQGVRQNLSTAKQYYGKACDLGRQIGCDNYRKLNNQGVQ